MSTKFTLLLSLFLGVATTITGQWTCPSDFPVTIQQGEIICYYFSNSSKLFEDAKTECNAQGGILAEPKTAAANNFLKNYIQTTISSYYWSPWIGITDVAQEGKWVYVSDGSEVVFTDWDAGEPNNAGSLGEDCATFNGHNSMWNDLSCANYIRYICQYGPKTDGKWSSYGDYSPCSTTCGDGTRFRTRTCTNPAPAFGGTDCTGPSVQNSTCDENPPCVDACTYYPCNNGGTCIPTSVFTRECICDEGYTKPDCDECSCWTSDDCGAGICPTILAVFIVLIIIAVIVSGCIMFKKTKQSKKKTSRKKFLR